MYRKHAHTFLPTSTHRRAYSYYFRKTKTVKSAIILHNMLPCRTDRRMHEHTDTHMHCFSDRPRSQSRVQAAMWRLRAPRWNKLTFRRLVRAFTALYLLPDSNSWNRSCAGSGDRPDRLDLETDRLMNISS